MIDHHICVACGHLDGDHGDGYCTKASGGRCFCLVFQPPFQAPSPSTDPQETTMTDHTQAAYEDLDELSRFMDDDDSPFMDDDDSPRARYLRASLNMNSMLAIADAIRGLAPNTTPRCTWTARIASGDPRCTLPANHDGTTHLLANGSRMGGASATPAATGDDLRTSQPEPGQVDGGKATEATGGIPWPPRGWKRYAADDLLDRAEKAELERDEADDRMWIAVVERHKVAEERDRYRAERDAILLELRAAFRNWTHDAGYPIASRIAEVISRHTPEG